MDPSRFDEVRELVSHNLPIMVEKHLKANPQEWHKPREIAPNKKITKAKLIQIVEQNPPLKELIMKQPAEFIRQVPEHPQLKELFKDIDPREIVEHFNPAGLKNAPIEAEFEDIKEESPEENQDEMPEKQDKIPENKEDDAEKRNVEDEEEDEGVDLDEISRMFR